jgi:hypothetical protein
MPFSERVKHLAKIKSAFRCCACHAPFAEVHHLMPEVKGGSSELSNAAPLCASCHDLYGGNPEKRKTLTQMRDFWWEIMEERRERLTDLSDVGVPYEINEDPKFGGALRTTGIAIYHVVFENEKFETAARTLAKLVYEAQQTAPNRKRFLYLDIDGHRNKKGGFDADMFELQRHFLMGFLMPYLTQLHIPLSGVANNKLQRNDIIADLEIIKSLGRKEINRAIARGIETIWLAEHDSSMRLPKQK